MNVNERKLPIEDVGQTYPREFAIRDKHFIALWPQPLELPDITYSSYVTVMLFDYSEAVSSEWIISIVNNYISADDVFEHDFLETVLITHTQPDSLTVTSHARRYLESQGTRTITTHRLNSQGEQPEPGPYLYSNGNLHQVWKLYEDIHGAFLHVLIPGPLREPFKLRTAGTTPQSLTIAVPSRIRNISEYKKQYCRPLEGFRIAVKDNFHIKGARTSACNRAFYELYPPPLKTAAAIQLLYDNGGTIVGTTKLASFAATEEPVECIDWQAPWNPRADEYQSPAGSSSGSGAAIAAYPWLDIAIGSDTSGSGRCPGHWNGCFAMRPTHGVLPHEGFLKSFPRFDVPTFFGRELKICRNFSQTWYGGKLPDLSHNDTKPYRIIYSLDYMSLISNQEQVKVIDRFAADLEASLGVSLERVSFEEAWNASPPLDTNGLSLQDYMKHASRDSFFYDDYHNFDTFRQDYHDKFGKAPYISPPVRWQWELSSHITKKANVEAVRRLDVYRDWFTKVIMKPETRNTLVLIPIEEISPRYRDEMPREHFNPVGVPNLFLSPILGAPELTVPIMEFLRQIRLAQFNHQ